MTSGAQAGETVKVPVPMRNVAVIGAGAGGICAAKHLLERGIAVTVFEMGSHVGGLWVYENDSGRSPAYASLHINSEARVTSYPDFPFPDGTPLYPTHQQVARYLQDYADHFDVTPHIRFRNRVTSVTPAADEPGWQVTVDEDQTFVFDGVVVAPGHQSEPAHPPFAQAFTGTYLHSKEYRTPEPYRGKDVLVIGTGNSALDIAADISDITAATALCARSPVLIMPRMMWGVPTARVLGKLERSWMPWPVRRFIRVQLARIVHGSMEQWGFKTPKKLTHPAGHPKIMSDIAYERIRVRPGIEDVDGAKVAFEDGTVEQFDVMIAATGFEIDLPFLSPEIVTVEDRSLDLYKRVLLPGWPGLYFVGFFNVSGGANIRMMDIQARWIAALATGELDRPTAADMRAQITAENREVQRRYPDSPRYGLELDPTAYPQSVEAELAQT